MLENRLKAYRHWLTMPEPKWQKPDDFPPLDYQDAYYYSAPKSMAEKLEKNLEEVDPELLGYIQ